jgi:hypothetical protein
MIVIICIPCEFAIRVMPVNVSNMRSAQELDQLVGKASSFWPDHYPCPRCGKNALGFHESTVDQKVLQAMTLQEATPQEAFAALNGLGFPDEQRCSLETVQELLLGMPVRRVIGKNVTGQERTLIDALELWDGTRVHFGAGAEGACIYRITKPVSYTQKTLSETNP